MLNGPTAQNQHRCRGPKTPLDNKILYLLTVLLSLLFNKLPWSEISSRLVFHPDAHILFLTSTRLLEIIEASSMNKRLTKEGRRWYARGLLENEPILKTLEKKASDFSLKTSLTTLSFMGLKADEEQSSTKEVYATDDFSI